jgi:hypothetical protein
MNNFALLEERCKKNPEGSGRKEGRRTSEEDA